MNTLIIGGCFLVALLALIGLVWALRSDPSPPAASKAPKSQAKDSEAVATGAPESDTGNREPSPLATQKLREHHTPLATQKLNHENTAEVEWRQDSLGQFRELSAELHSLRQQAQRIEDRLTMLTEVVERIEHSENGRLDLEEETIHRADASSTY